jgi:hypothetical protein
VEEGVVVEEWEWKSLGKSEWEWKSLGSGKFEREPPRQRS